MHPTDRYSRQVRFAAFGSAGQERLGRARVLLVGLGALGTSLADTLTRAGVGELWLVDRDVVEVSNLQRQVLYTEQDAGEPKAHAAAARLAAVNSGVVLRPIAEDFTPDVYAGLGARPDLILDGTDNFPTRYLLNDLALRDGIDWIYAGAVGSRGTAMVIRPGRTPCLRCLLPQPPATAETETCETAGVLAPAVAAVTAFQAAEALKLLGGCDDAVTRGILMLDVWHHEHAVRMADGKPSEHCPACAGTDYPALAADWRGSVALCGRDAVQVQPRGGARVELAALAASLGDAVEDLDAAPHLLRFAAEGCRFSVFPGGRALIFGVAEPDRARILYDRYVGA